MFTNAQSTRIELPNSKKCNVVVIMLISAALSGLHKTIYNQNEDKKKPTKYAFKIVNKNFLTQETKLGIKSKYGGYKLLEHLKLIAIWY